MLHDALLFAFRRGTGAPPRAPEVVRGLLVWTRKGGLRTPARQTRLPPAAIARMRGGGWASARRANGWGGRLKWRRRSVAVPSPLRRALLYPSGAVTPLHPSLPPRATTSTPASSRSHLARHRTHRWFGYLSRSSNNGGGPPIHPTVCCRRDLCRRPDAPSHATTVWPTPCHAHPQHPPPPPLPPPAPPVCASHARGVTLVEMPPPLLFGSQTVHGRESRAGVAGNGDEAPFPLLCGRLGGAPPRSRASDAGARGRGWGGRGGCRTLWGLARPSPLVALEGG